jgi:AsmA-like C-terminal region
MATATPVTKLRRNRSSRFPHRLTGKLIVILLLFVAVGCVVAVVFAMRHWPFAKGPVLDELGEAGDSQVQVRAFHETYFPSPGCVLEGLIFRHGDANSTPLITIDKLTIQGTYAGMLAMRVKRVTVQGLHIVVPPFGTGRAFHTSKSKITVGELVANGAVLEFALHEPDKPPLRFDIREASLKNVGWSGPTSYRVKVHNPTPPGEITAEGKFGVWSESEPENTPVSGNYTLSQADLSVYGGIAGTLSSSGTFDGNLGRIEITGKTDTPDFVVKSGGHPMHLTSDFRAHVDAIHGDTFLEHVGADFWKTHFDAQGDIIESMAGSKDGGGKIAKIDLASSHARIEDLLLLFVEAEHAPMSGPVKLHAHVELLSGKEEFLRKIKLSGGFGVGAGTFTDPSTQQDINNLSAGARGEKNKNKNDKIKEDKDDPETVLTDLAGEVNVLGGTARFSDLSFGIPGAAARMQGTYDLTNYKIDLRGQLKLDSKLSYTQSGTKALLLRALDPLFKKRKTREIVPVHIYGTYKHPAFGLDLNDKAAQEVGRPSHKAARAEPGSSQK